MLRQSHVTQAVREFLFFLSLRPKNWGDISPPLKSKGFTSCTLSHEFIGTDGAAQLFSIISHKLLLQGEQAGATAEPRYSRWLPLPPHFPVPVSRTNQLSRMFNMFRTHIDTNCACLQQCQQHAERPRSLLVRCTSPSGPFPYVYSASLFVDLPAS